MSIRSLVDSDTKNQFAKMDKMYRHQRHFYDLTRKYYLFGRDTLIKRMEINEGDNVLEVGCGTGRNLLALARAHERARFYGLDASQEMLKTAQDKLARKSLSERITLKRELAENLDPQELFGLKEPFNVVYFSYTLSMVPTWRGALEAAWSSLKTNGRIYVLDFWDQGQYPALFRKMLKAWLGKFSVEYRPALLLHLYGMEDAGIASLKVDSIARRYAFIAELKKRSE
jgi:S-adenosylmethionine-diacylgycerolhomoserine-N-methlytransferase